MRDKRVPFSESKKKIIRILKDGRLRYNELVAKAVAAGVPESTAKKIIKNENEKKEKGESWDFEKFKRGKATYYCLREDAEHEKKTVEEMGGRRSCLAQYQVEKWKGRSSQIRETIKAFIDSLPAVDFDPRQNYNSFLNFGSIDDGFPFQRLLSMSEPDAAFLSQYGPLCERLQRYYAEKCCLLEKISSRVSKEHGDIGGGLEPTLNYALGMYRVVVCPDHIYNLESIGSMSLHHYNNHFCLIIEDRPDEGWIRYRHKPDEPLNIRIDDAKNNLLHYVQGEDVKLHVEKIIQVKIELEKEFLEFRKNLNTLLTIHLYDFQ